MPTRRSTMLGLGFMLATAVAPDIVVFAQDKAATIDGYDPVAYFTEKRPVKGQPAISYDWDGRRYLFANGKHRDLFTANPDRYEPQFNGLCAGNVSRGRKVKADPTIWRVVDGKLYLFAAQQTNEDAVPGKVALAQSRWKDVK